MTTIKYLPSNLLSHTTYLQIVHPSITTIFLTDHMLHDLLPVNFGIGEPKAIPWTHSTPLKAAADAWSHMDIHRGDVVCWPTNLGWMMGPWLVYATLLNGASIAIYDGSPLGPGFAKFVQVIFLHIVHTFPFYYEMLWFHLW